jgi:hypothetical protein
MSIETFTVPPTFTVDTSGSAEDAAVFDAVAEDGAAGASAGGVTDGADIKRCVLFGLV